MGSRAPGHSRKMALAASTPSCHLIAGLPGDSRSSTLLKAPVAPRSAHSRHGRHQVRRALVATANEGYSIDGSASESMKTFNFTCTPSGEFSKQDTFQRIKYGQAPEVPHATKEDKGDKVFEDTVKYTRETGYPLNGEAAGGKRGSRSSASPTPRSRPRPYSSPVS